MDGELEEDSKGDFRGDFKQDIEGDLLSSSGQVRSRSGLVQVWFSLQPKFYSFELDSEVGRLVSVIMSVLGTGDDMDIQCNSVPDLSSGFLDPPGPTGDNSFVALKSRVSS